MGTMLSVVSGMQYALCTAPQETTTALLWVDVEYSAPTSPLLKHFYRGIKNADAQKTMGYACVALYTKVRRDKPYERRQSNRAPAQERPIVDWSGRDAHATENTENTSKRPSLSNNA